MKFGVGLFGMQTHPDLPYTHRDLYRNTLEQVKLAEESDSRFYNYGFKAGLYKEDRKFY